MFFKDSGIVECPLYDRAKMLAEDTLTGPALIEADDSTVVVPATWTARCDAMGNLMLTRGRVQ